MKQPFGSCCSQNLSSWV